MLKIIYTRLSEFTNHDLDEWIQHYNLSQKSQRKIYSYYQLADRYRALISEIFKYNILADCLGILPENIDIQQDIYHRPYLTNNLPQGMDFNISHSGDYVIMAVSNQVKVGIDIEFIDPEINYTNLKALTFSVLECGLINSALEFFNLWSKKEALIKVVGKGFLDEMYQNTQLDHNSQQVYSYLLTNYKFYELTLDKRYKTYLCYTYIENLDVILDIEEYKP